MLGIEFGSSDCQIGIALASRLFLSAQGMLAIKLKIITDSKLHNAQSRDILA
jgi:hypothetical protein